MLNERDIRHQSVVAAARRMMLAARTAPKAKGVDIIEIALVEKREDLEALSLATFVKAASSGRKFLERDAANILQGEAVMLLGTRRNPMALDCGYCGYPSCEAKPEGNPCAFNSIDLGIAIGSACASAADQRIDTRVMFSVGWAALGMGYMPECSQVIAIALSASAKNPFFDRKS